jgi:large subunit ribosomal protein L24
MQIRVNDRVEIMAGNEKGQRGKVLRVLPGSNRIVIDNVNMVKRHKRAQNVGGKQVRGGIIQFEAPIDISNVMLVCPHTDKPTRVGIRRDENGRAIRVSRRSGKDID